MVKAAEHSWFSSPHIALIVSIAAVVITVVVSVLTIYYTRRSARAAERGSAAAEDSSASANASAEAAKDSAAYAKVSAKAAKDMADIERDREYDRTRPKLRGRLVPQPGRSDSINAWLEVHLDASTPRPLLKILLTVPPGAWFARSGPVTTLSLGSNDYGFPEEGWQHPPVRPGHPARWRVHRSDKAHGTLAATARCTREDGVVWEDVEVPISQDLDDATCS
jgi:hypothetical protein